MAVWSTSELGHWHGLAGWLGGWLRALVGALQVHTCALCCAWPTLFCVEYHRTTCIGTWGLTSYPTSLRSCSGPVGEILPFFERQLDFVCPMRKDAGSFLQVGRPAQLPGLLRVKLGWLMPAG